MAGDILLYQTDIVPIGDDQRQHLELARDVAARFNSRYGETFKVPEGVYPEVGARIMDLQEPTKKMSTTPGRRRGRCGSSTSRRDPEEVQVRRDGLGREVRRGDDKPGVTNLIDILASLTGETAEAIEVALRGRRLRAVQDRRRRGGRRGVTPIQERYRELRSDPAELQRLLALGADKAREASAPTLELDLRADGLREAPVRRNLLLGTSSWRC